jgi:NADH dehydrogenase I D subunit
MEKEFFHFPEGLASLIESIDLDKDMPTLQVKPEGIVEIARHLKSSKYLSFKVLTDLTAVHERRENHPFTIVYHLYSVEGNRRIRLKVNLDREDQKPPTITTLWRSANWYEREVFDMFGIEFEGHPNMKRILMPANWKGWPLRKEHPIKGTDMGDYKTVDAMRDEEYQMAEPSGDEFEEGEVMVLNIGPTHPTTHGIARFVVRLNGEMMVDVTPEIGYLHRCFEKIAEGKTYHQYLVWTDRIDYLAGFLNELPYVLAVEKLLGIDVPERAGYIRVLLCELFRICSHLVWLGTYAHDVGAMSPVFFTFRDREEAFEIVELISGGRMHPSFFRIGGVAEDIPEGFEEMVRSFIKSFASKMADYENLLTGNIIFEKRTREVGVLSLEEAIDFGVTGPNLRASGLEFDLRKRQPYSFYDRFRFDIPTEKEGDGYARYLVRMEEMRQSLRIIEQAIDNMPGGDYISQGHRYTVPEKEEAIRDIESLIFHFLHFSSGFRPPIGEVYQAVESPRGEMGFYIVSRGEPKPYRLRIRVASFPHVQVIPYLAKGRLLADLTAIIGSIDYVVSDLDR